MGNGTSPDDSAEPRVDDRRRQLLAALGATCIPAVAGCSGSPGDESTTTAPTTTTDMSTTNTTTTTTEDGTEIDDRFGFTGVDGEEKPVEPDHTIDLLFSPRENNPIPEFYFEPTGLQIEVGDTVQFNLATPHHNVNAYHPQLGYTQRVPDGVPAFSSPVLTQGDYWMYTFDKEGVHDVMCAPHEVFGMVGRIVVGSPTGPGANAVGEAPGGEQARPPEFTAALVLNDPAMQPDAIVEAGSVSWSDLPAESKRPMLRPVEE